MMIRWHGEPDPVHIRAVDAYFVSAAEHGMNASTFTSRVIASTGADVAAAISGAIGAMSGPCTAVRPVRVLHMIEEVERTGDAEGYIKGVLDRGERLMGFGHRVYRAEDPRARVLRRTCLELDAPRYEVAEALEPPRSRSCASAAPTACSRRTWSSGRRSSWTSPTSRRRCSPAMFTCARLAGWSAHIYEQKRTGRLVRPSARYVGPGPRVPQDVPGWKDSMLFPYDGDLGPLYEQTQPLPPF
jgi:citrate synthase